MDFAGDFSDGIGKVQGNHVSGAAKTFFTTDDCIAREKTSLLLE